jgi:hypothetical protein
MFQERGQHGSQILEQYAPRNSILCHLNPDGSFCPSRILPSICFNNRVICLVHELHTRPEVMVMLRVVGLKEKHMIWDNFRVLGANRYLHGLTQAQMAVHLTLPAQPVPVALALEDNEVPSILPIIILAERRIMKPWAMCTLELTNVNLNKQ